MLSDFEFQCSVNIDGLDHFCALRRFLYTYSVLWSVLVVLLFFNAFDFIYQKKKKYWWFGSSLFTPTNYFVLLCYTILVFSELHQCLHFWSFIICLILIVWLLCDCPLPIMWYDHAMSMLCTATCLLFPQKVQQLINSICGLFSEVTTNYLNHEFLKCDWFREQKAPDLERNCCLHFTIIFWNMSVVAVNIDISYANEYQFCQGACMLPLPILNLC